MRLPLRLPLVTLAACVAAACSTQPAPPAKLAPVAALARPALPPWIASVSPSGGGVVSLAQVRVIFAKPVTKVEALSGDGPRAVLDHVRIEPALKGRFSVLTPRMVGFIPDQALPVGTRVRVTLTAGLRDLDGDALPGDLAWTFETAPLELKHLPKLTAADDESTPPPAGLAPKIPIVANAAVDPASLAAQARADERRRSRSDERRNRDDADTVPGQRCGGSLRPVVARLDLRGDAAAGAPA